MDTELLRTFLEVRRTRHFARAAGNLFVTQAAVSARIRQLEELLGQRLLTRARNNIQLTPAGHRLVPYAESILEAWQRATLEANAGEAPLIALGCLPSLREIYLDDWLTELVADASDLRLQVDSANTLEIITRVRDQSLDLGLVYEAPRSRDLWVEALTSFELLLVSTRRGVDIAAGLDDYVEVDWGTSLALARDTRAEGVRTTRARLDSALLARRLLLARGGSAFLPGPVVAEDLTRGRLHRVAGRSTPRRLVYLIGTTETRDAPGVGELAAALHRRAEASKSD